MSYRAPPTLEGWASEFCPGLSCRRPEGPEALMTELTEQEQEKLNTGRLMRAESDLILPLIDTKQAVVVGAIVSAFRAGSYDRLTGLAAELTTLFEMRNQIKQKIKTAEGLERKLYEKNEGENT